MVVPNVLQVAVPGPLARLFDYLPPRDAEGAGLEPGCRVRVPFGRGRRTGIIVAHADESDLEPRRLRRIGDLLDRHPSVPEDLMGLARWAAEYYHHPLGEVLATMLPAALRSGEPPDTSPPPRWRATRAGHEAIGAGLARAPLQERLLALVASHADGVDAATLRTLTPRHHAPLKALADKGLVEAAPPVTDRPPRPVAGPVLNPAQTRAVNAVNEALGGFRSFLLHGVTGSGKTEVYLAAIRATIERGRQALVLVPEIGLTPQLLARFGERLGTTIAVLHSGLTDRERLIAWQRAADGSARVVLGTRSAVFVPLPDAGLIVVDEEHDPSLKQQDGFRYHARDLAVVRAQRTGIPIVLGSATPSLESLANARAGRFTRLGLEERAGGAQPPAMQLVDVRRRRLEEGLSAPLVEAMWQQFEAGGQVLLFLNRRGWSPTLICDDCGWNAECSRCDARMTVHGKQSRLRCHHCGADRPAPQRCPDCGSEELVGIGQGTERVEQALVERFPDHEVVRLDRDSTRRRGALDAKLERVRSGDAHILLGTQMLAKGHDFPEVGLVGVLDADRGLFGADFRAPEHLAQTILQVAGRAGRAERPGRVLIQTRNPQHPLLQALVEHGFDAVAETLLAEREAAGFPPAARLALVRAESPHAESPEHCLQAAAKVVRECGVDEVEVFGPAPAPMERLAGRYRAQLALQSPTRKPLHAVLRVLRPWLEAAPDARKVRWSIDVDPVETL
ncbi:MAG: primosomal protein N' [Halofilum sp. (in: g-proteobacteria)]|nr:primosomal protein N' [Halofilum sp. (in: g-proteobacteria)]